MIKNFVIFVFSVSFIEADTNTCMKCVQQGKNFVMLKNSQQFFCSSINPRVFLIAIQNPAECEKYLDPPKPVK